MKLIKIIVIAALSLLVKFNLYSQSLPVGTTSIENNYRNGQLMGTTDTSVSFTVRPVYPSRHKKPGDVFYPDSAGKRYNLLEADGSGRACDHRFKWSILPFS